MADMLVRATVPDVGLAGFALVSDMASRAMADTLMAARRRKLRVPLTDVQLAVEATQLAHCRGAPASTVVVVSRQGAGPPRGITTPGTPRGLYLHWLASTGVPALHPAAAHSAAVRGVGRALVSDLVNRFALTNGYDYVSLIIEYDHPESDARLEAFYAQRDLGFVTLTQATSTCVTEAGTIAGAPTPSHLMRSWVGRARERFAVTEADALAAARAGASAPMVWSPEPVGARTPVRELDVMLSALTLMTSGQRSA